MKTSLVIVAVSLLTGLTLTPSVAKAQTRFSIGIGVGPDYYAPPPVVYESPYPGYYWTDGYYDPYGAWVVGGWFPRAYVRPYGYAYPARRFYRGEDGYQRGSYREDFRRGRGFDRDDFRRGGDWDRGRGFERRR